jgi:hypothetical protein
MGVARCSDAAIGIPNHGLDAAAVGLQVNEVGLNGPTCIGWLVAEEEQALVDFNIVLPLMLVVLNLCMVWGFSW